MLCEQAAHWTRPHFSAHWMPPFMSDFRSAASPWLHPIWLVQGKCRQRHCRCTPPFPPPRRGLWRGGGGFASLADRSRPPRCPLFAVPMSTGAVGAQPDRSVLVAIIERALLHTDPRRGRPHAHAKNRRPNAGCCPYLLESEDRRTASTWSHILRTTRKGRPTCAGDRRGAFLNHPPVMPAVSFSNDMNRGPLPR